MTVMKTLSMHGDQTDCLRSRPSADTVARVRSLRLGLVRLTNNSNLLLLVELLLVATLLPMARFSTICTCIGIQFWLHVHVVLTLELPFALILSKALTLSRLVALTFSLAFRTMTTIFSFALE